MSDDDSWDEEVRPFHGYPLAATLTGCALLVALAVSEPRLAGNQPLNLLLAAGAGLGLVLWLIAFIATIRRAPLLWKLGSLVVLLAVGAGGGYGAHRLGIAQARGDLTSLAEAEYGPDGTPSFPRDAQARGPISRLFVANFQAATEEKRDYSAEVGKLGLDVLGSPFLLAQKPEILGNCGAIDALKTKAAEDAAHRKTRLAEVLAALARAPVEAELKRGAGLMLAPVETPERIDAMRAQEESNLDSTKALCVLLAKRSWSNASGYFGFGSAADRAEFDAITTRRHDAARDTSILQREGRDRAIAGREILRDLLDASK
jgi:hypothetical protein